MADIRGAGFDEKTGSVSGLGTFVVSPGSTSDDLKFELSYQNHGTPPDHAALELRDGGRTRCLNGQCQASTDATGLIFYPSMWGKAPSKLKAGVQWTVDLAEPWELGPPGHQTVTVIAVNPATNTVILKREGDGDGPFAGEPKQIHVKKNGKTYLVDFSPGHAHWLGQATIRGGIIVSDEIMVYRTVLLKSTDTGAMTALYREYTLQSISPQPDNDSQIPI